MSVDMPILVVDDSTSMRAAIRQILKDAGYKNISMAQDGAEGMKILQASYSASGGKQIGLVLCDWMMPNKSGIEMLKEIRQNARMSTLPFIMITNEQKTENILLAVKSGTTDFIVKPFASTLLLEKIEKIFGRPS